MAKGARYCVPFRRRREGKTDYRTRKALILSGKPRLVIRVSLKNVIAQVIVAKPYGDEVLVSAHSKQLARDYGWKAPMDNLPSAYLTGLLCGLKAKDKGINEAVLDIGLRSPSKGSRIFAALKGVLDAGVSVPYNNGILPDDMRIMGGHIAQYAERLALTPEKYRAVFSKYLGRGLTPENIVRHFMEVKKALTSSFKGG